MTHASQPLFFRNRNLILIGSFLTGVLCTGPAHAFECKTPVDPAKALIFIDINFGLTEMRSAEEAACARGETFVRIPAPTGGEEAAHQSLVRLTYTTTRIENLRAEAKRNGCKLPTTSPEASVSESPESTDTEESPDARCAPLLETFAQLSADSDKYTTLTEAFVKKMRDENGGGDFIDTAIKNKMAELALKEVRPSAIIISGHSNGSAIGGRYGGILLTTVQKHILDAYAKNTGLLADLRSLFLWGCNTLNPYAPEKWISVFPSLDLIVGFQGSAPSNLNTSSWTVLDGLLRQEAQMTAAAPSLSGTDDVKALFDRVPNISGTVAAVYLHDRLNDRKWFYERVLETTETNRTAWITRASPLLTAKDCAPVAEQIKADQEYIESILAGLAPIPENTGFGPLREAYTRSRRNDICRSALRYDESADRISMLLFWHDVKKNAVRALAPDTKKLEFEFASLTDNPQTFALLVERANEANLADLKTIKADLEKNKNGALTILRINRSGLSASLVGESLLPWTRQRQRELRRLFHREKVLKRKAAKGNAESKAALSTVSQDIANHLAAKRISLHGGKSDTQKYSDTIAKWETLLKQYENFLEDLPSRAMPADAPTLLTDLREFASHMAPKTVVEMTPLSYAEVRSLHLARQAALERIEKVIGKSPALFKSLERLITAMRTWQKRFEQTAILPRTDCMEFFTWHEYFESPTEESQPRFSCHYTL